MPTISRFYGILIQMYFTDRVPPHFHARYDEFEVVIDICTLETLQGGLPARAFELVLEWAEQYRKELMEDWELCAQNQMPNSITPLI